MELLQMVHDLVLEGDEVAIHLVTQSDHDTSTKLSSRCVTLAKMPA
jgi:hypothetical protein